MKIFKLAIISIAVLFLLLTSIGLILPSTVRVTRNINIHAPFSVLQDYITNMKKWHVWMEGVDSSTIKITSLKGGLPITATINKQQIRIIKKTKNEMITVWQNRHGNNQLGVFQFGFDSATNTMNFNWYFEQKNSWYPWERLSSLANEKIVGPFMEHSLDKLKSVTEKSIN